MKSSRSSPSPPARSWSSMILIFFRIDSQHRCTGQESSDPLMLCVSAPDPASYEKTKLGSSGALELCRGSSLENLGGWLWDNFGMIFRDLNLLEQHQWTCFRDVLFVLLEKHQWSEGCLRTFEWKSMLLGCKGWHVAKYHGEIWNDISAVMKDVMK